MKNVLVRLLFMLLLFVPHCTFAQQKELSWEELQQRYQFPKWYTDARFGVWATVGPQSVPRLGGGWYARHMFMEDVGGQTFGRNAYDCHLKTFGPQSQKGYMEVINQ